MSRHRTPFSSALWRAVWAALLCLPLAASSAAAEEGSSLNVIEFRTQVRELGGVVRCGLFARDGWLKKPVGADTARITGRQALCVFKKIPAGTYGLSAFHDQNNNGKLDTNLLGMPTEDYCASNNARGVLGPPSFNDAKFVYKAGTKRLEARMK
jgi:uncharacterized protein (DUF2141 family)